MGKKPGAGEDPLRTLCDSLRAKNGVEWRSAVLADERVEYFRGKDLAAYVKEKPGAISAFVSGNKQPEDQVKEFMELLIRRNLVLRCDRLYKKPKPGKKRLAKWPRKLVPFSRQEQGWSEESFYSWLYDRPTSPWQYVWSLLMVVAVFAVCCFQLAPYKVRLAVVYLSAALLILILGTILVRGVVALATWLVTGKSLWIFPNMMDDTLGIDQAFKPIWSYDSESDSGSLLMRLAAAASFASFVFVLYSFAPEKARLADGAKHAHDALLDWILAQPNYTAIADANKINGTASNSTAAAGTPLEGGPEAPVPPPENEDVAGGGQDASGEKEEGGVGEGEEGGRGPTVVPPLDELLADLGDVDDDEEGESQGSGSAGGGGSGADEL